MVATTANTLLKLGETLETLAKENKNGVLTCKYKDSSSLIYLFSGKIIYATMEKHRVRRWRRSLIKAGVNYEIESIPFEQELPWEYQLFYHELGQKKIGMTQIKDIIRSAIQEILFELSGHSDLEIHWEDKPKTQSGLALVLALSTAEVNVLIDNCNKLRQEWDQLGLKSLSPMIAPLGTIDESHNLPSLDGKSTLWDLAQKDKKSINQLVSILIPYVRKGIVKFREIPDLPSPQTSAKKVEKPPLAKTTTPEKAKSSQSLPDDDDNTPSPPTTATKTSGKKSILIACIDDSPVVAHNIKKILTPVGYEILAIPEPMHGFAQLLEHQPQLILLDINMPNANGYSVCQFLRNSPIFEKTPIIILTGQDTNIDRARAKLVGATDFLSKPPEAKTLLSLIEKYLKINA